VKLLGAGWSVVDEPLGLEILYVKSRSKGRGLESFMAGLVEELLARRDAAD
jgi:hypothetical protein